MMETEEEGIDFKELAKREFPGSPVVRTPHFHCQGPWFDIWLGN